LGLKGGFEITSNYFGSRPGGDVAAAGTARNGTQVTVAEKERKNNWK
jgi:uncharacterized protein YgiM (DUF1202 family)